MGVLVLRFCAVLLHTRKYISYFVSLPRPWYDRGGRNPTYQIVSTVLTEWLAEKLRNECICTRRMHESYASTYVFWSWNLSSAWKWPLTCLASDFLSATTYVRNFSSQVHCEVISSSLPAKNRRVCQKDDVAGFPGSRDISRKQQQQNKQSKTKFENSKDGLRILFKIRIRLQKRGRSQNNVFAI